MKMQLTFSGSIQAIDNGDRRIIAGKIAPYGEIGNTSAGKVMFAPGSITAAEISKVKLLMSHDNSQVIGRMQSMTSDESGLYASFKISASTKGNDAILLAQEQLMDGLSVGVEVIASKPEKDYLLVTSASLREVSLVETPAFVGAGVQKIAASESDTVEQPNQPIETESEATVTTAPETPNEDKTEEAAAPTVEAARPIIRPSALNSQSVRSPITTGGAYLEHTIKASLGNDDSRLYVKAADDSFTTNPAFSPVSYVRDVATNTNAMRPVIDACGGTRALSSYGMTVSIPKITANSTAATVAEGGDPTGTTAITSAYVNATVIKKMGFQRYSVELLDRSDPSFYEIMLSNLRDAYAQATDQYVIAQITAGGTQATATAADSAGIISFVSTESPAVYNATKRTATAFVSGTSIWSTLLSATDTTGRPIYNAQPMQMNPGGTVNPTSIRGNVLGLDYYTDANMVATSIDESAFIIEPRSIEIFESPVLTLATNVPTTGEIEISLYGYIAAQAVFAGGLRRFNLT
jgi:HK97 family phage prohead protease/HK97 family phage major capsid protein